MNRKLGRRRLLVAGGGAASAFLVAACDGLSTEPATPSGGSGDNAPADHQAPILADRVDADTLPPPKDRLPAEPLVVQPHDQVGKYGGELRSAILGPAEAIQLHRIVGYETLVRWTPDWTDEVIPNIAKSFEASADALEFTFVLREGMKWSDGEPFTADDIVFAQNDVLNNAEINPATTADPVAEKVDEHTVRLVFAEPNGLFLQQLATPGDIAMCLVTKPFHHLKQFHVDYNDDIDALVDEAGAASWVDLFPTPSRLDWDDAAIPTLNPWILTTAVGEGDRVSLERNPYYWKVDPDGNQLPYVDHVTFEMIAEDEAILVRTLSGEIDLQLRPVNALANKPVLAREREAGGYDFFDAIPANMNTMALALNLAHRNELVREVFRERDFRIGLSHAINRQEIIDTVYQQQGEAWQCAPRPESSLYNDGLAKQYTEFDVDRANEHLDRVLSDKDGDGFRLLPDGKRLGITIEFATGIWPDYPDALELVKTYWRDVGVHTSVRGMDRSLFLERSQASDHDAAVWQGSGGHTDAVLNPGWYFPSYISNAAYAATWTTWYLSDGAEGEQPPKAMRRQMELYDERVRATTDQADQAEAMTEILDIAREEFWVMGINLQPDEYGIVSNRLRNVPPSMPNAWDYPTPAPTNPEQYYYES